MIIKRKQYSSLEEFKISSPNEAIVDYVLDPLDKSIIYIDSTPLIKLRAVERTSKNIKSTVRPWKKLLKREK